MLILLAVDSFGSMITEVGGYFTTLFGIITGNWLLIALVGTSIIIPLVFSLISYLRNR